MVYKNYTDCMIKQQGLAGQSWHELNFPLTGVDWILPNGQIARFHFGRDIYIVELSLCEIAERGIEAICWQRMHRLFSFFRWAVGVGGTIDVKHIDIVIERRWGSDEPLPLI